MTKLQFQELVGIAIGEASMCWSELPAGVFDSTRASGLVDKLLDPFAELEKQLAEKSKRVKELEAQVKRWENKEVRKASCCNEMEEVLRKIIDSQDLQALQNAIAIARAALAKGKEDT